MGLAVAGSVVVLGSLFGVGIVTEDLATRRALAELSAADRTISIHHSSTDGSEDAEDDRIARDALLPVLPLTGPILAVRMYQVPTDWFRVLATDDVEQWAAPTKGRLPGPCTMGATCEAVRLGPELPNGIADVGTVVTLAGTQIEIVGIAQVLPDRPIQVLGVDQSPALLVDGLSAIQESAALRQVQRTNYWFAPIDPLAAHSWTLADLSDRADAVDRALASAGSSFPFSTPESTLRTVHDRTEVALGRLVFISSLIVGVLLAFAAFAAAIERSDVGLEERRLRAAGASRGARLLFIAGEAIVPAVGGAIVGELGAALAIGLLAGSQGLPVDTVLGLALLQPAGIVLTLLLVALAMVATMLGIHPSTGRLLQPRVVIAAVLPAGLILGWQRLSAGPADPARLAAEATSPASALLPGALGLSVILGSLVLLPPVLRWLARVTRRAPIGIRLATISVAREPLRPAAVMTLLAFSVGAVVFGQTYAATLRQGAVDQAAFAAGLDLRVQGLAAEGPFALFVVPQLQNVEGTDLDVEPMIRLTAATATQQSFTLVGFDAAAMDRLKGWRSDFSPTAPSELGRAIRLDGSWELAGHELPADARAVSIDVQYSGDPIQVAAVVEEPSGAIQHVDLGALAPGRQTLHGDIEPSFPIEFLVPGAPIRWRVLGLLARNGGDAVEGGPNEGQRQEGDLTILNLPGLIDPTAPLHVQVESLGPTLVRPPARTDGLVLPAIVSPELAADVDPSGILDIATGSDLRLRLHPVGTTTKFPSIPDPGPVAIVDYAPLRLAINAHEPGEGQPNQVLIGTPSDARTAEVITALQQGLFPRLVIASRPAIEAARSSDPFAIGVVWGLVVGAIAGLVLSLVGVLLATASELRDERGELGELEAQGTTPRALISLVVLRTIAMCSIGTLTGVAMGVALGWFVASSLGVGAEGGAPNPPLALVAPWTLIIGSGATLLLVIGVAVYTLTRRHFARPSLGADVR